MVSFDLSSADFRASLTETIQWCALQPMTARFTETPEFIRFHELLDNASKLRQQAYDSRNRFWARILRRDHEKTDEYKASEDLYRQAWRFSFPSMLAELRSPDLKPQASLMEARSRQSREAIVKSVVEKRSRLVRPNAPPLASDVRSDLGGGRLVAFVPVDSLSDGAAAVASNWFFDDDNAPPWDTWIAFREQILVSWVPLALVPLVQKGIDVHVEGCIRWLDD